MTRNIALSRLGSASPTLKDRLNGRVSRPPVNLGGDSHHCQQKEWAESPQTLAVLEVGEDTAVANQCHVA